MPVSCEEYGRRFGAIPEVLHWALQNDPTVHALMGAYSLGDVTYEQALEQCVAWLARDRKRLMEQCVRLWQGQPAVYEFPQQVQTDPPVEHVAPGSETVKMFDKLGTRIAPLET